MKYHQNRLCNCIYQVYIIPGIIYLFLTLYSVQCTHTQGVDLTVAIHNKNCISIWIKNWNLTNPETRNHHLLSFFSKKKIKNQGESSFKSTKLELLKPFVNVKNQSPQWVKSSFKLSQGVDDLLRLKEWMLIWPIFKLKLI